MRSSEVNQEFTHIATPEENAYIEAYHSIFEREVMQRFEFSSYYESSLTITPYNDFYNNCKLHGGIGYKTPQQKWDDYYAETSVNNNFADERCKEQEMILNSFDKNVQFIRG